MTIRRKSIRLTYLVLATEHLIQNVPVMDIKDRALKTYFNKQRL